MTVTTSPASEPLAMAMVRPTWSTRRRLRQLLPWLPVVALGGFTLAVLFAPVVVTADPDALNLSRKLQPPSTGALLGTDNLGRDGLVRLVHGGQRTLVVGMVTVALSTLVVVGVGVTSGYLGGWVDLLVAGVLDILLALPGLLVTLALLGTLGTGEWTLIIALVGASWAGEARILRGAVYSVRESAYVEAARSSGAPQLRILVRHIFPNVLTPVIVLASLNLGEVLLVVSALSFLGLGVQPPQADWGVMLADSRIVFNQAPWLMLAPGLCIVSFSLLANLAGDTLRGGLNPRARR